MTSYERMRAVLEKTPVDKMPFWPKITGSYVNFQREKWRKMSIPEIHKYIGSEYLSYTGIEYGEVLPAGMSTEKKYTPGGTRTCYRIGSAALTEASVTTQDVEDSHPTEYPIKTHRDMLVMTEYYSKIQYTVTADALKQHRTQLAQSPDKLFVFSMPESPLMDLVQYRMGIESFSYLYFDYPEETEALMEAMHGANLRLHELLCDVSPAEYFLSVENTSTSLISPSLFADYCVKHLSDYSHVMKNHGKKQILHMCGKLKAILPEIEKIPAIAMEAFSAPSTGDTYIKDGYDLLPTKSLIGGSGATIWAMQSAKQISDRILADLRMAGGPKNLFLSSGGVIPFSATPEMIKEVWETIQQELY